MEKVRNYFWNLLKGKINKQKIPKMLNENKFPFTLHYLDDRDKNNFGQHRTACIILHV
jgi:hypothetical protein